MRENRLAAMPQSVTREAKAQILATEQFGMLADRTRLQPRRPSGDSPQVMLLTVLLLVAAAAPVARAGLERVCTLSNFYEARRHSARTSCSRQLPERLRAICRGPIHIPGGSSYGQTMRHKRDVAATAVKAADSGAAEMALVGGDGVFLDRRAASAYLHKRQADDGGIQGIVCECCIYPCKRREMSQYCANGGASASRRRRREVADTAGSESDSSNNTPLVIPGAETVVTADDEHRRSFSTASETASSGNSGAAVA